jgi:GlpG protein
MYLIRIQGNRRAQEACVALQHFLQQPDDPRYQSPQRNRSPVAKTIDWSSVLMVRVGPMTMSLVLLSVLISLLAMFGANESVAAHLWFHLSSITQGQLQRLITPVFLHLSALQLVVSVLMLWVFGGLLEKRLGAASLLLLVMLVGVVSNLTQYLVTGPLFGGLHGVVYGVFGYLWFRGHRDQQFGVRLHFGIILLMLAWLLLSWFNVSSAVAKVAQLSGLLMGVMLGFAASTTPSGVNHV